MGLQLGWSQHLAAVGGEGGVVVAAAAAAVAQSCPPTLIAYVSFPSAEQLEFMKGVRLKIKSYPLLCIYSRSNGNSVVLGHRCWHELEDLLL